MLEILSDRLRNSFHSLLIFSCDTEVAGGAVRRSAGWQVDSFHIGMAGQLVRRPVGKAAGW
jgi:hypothetical protein